ncbi:MAG: class I SAM-dependent methyltransferase, partial [Pseudomonadota bacterium]
VGEQGRVMTDRVLREKQAWNDGIDRAAFEQAFSHGGAYWDERIDEILRETFVPYTQGDFLEIGSATWHSWIHRLKTPVGQLTCINISETELENGRLPAGKSHVEPTFRIMDAHKLDYPDQSFDVVFGKAILHHLDYAVALDEIARVLRPGGVFVFMAPLVFQPVLYVVRALTPSLSPPDEEPIDARHWRLFEERFENTLYPMQFISAGAAPLSARLFRQKPQNILTRTVFEMDRALAGVPGLRLWFRSALIVGKKRP